MEFIGGDPYKGMWDILVLINFTYTPGLFQSYDFRIDWMRNVKFSKDIVSFLLIELLNVYYA